MKYPYNAPAGRATPIFALISIFALPFPELICALPALQRLEFSETAARTVKCCEGFFLECIDSIADMEISYRIRPRSLPCPTTGRTISLPARTAGVKSRLQTLVEGKATMGLVTLSLPLWQTHAPAVTRTTLVRERRKQWSLRALTKHS